MYFSFQDPLNLYLVMEFLPGGNLPLFEIRIVLSIFDYEIMLNV